MTIPGPNTPPSGTAASATRVVSRRETAPAFLFYLPVALWWGALSLRYRSCTLPTLANPAIRAGGLCGESKSEVLGLFGPVGRGVLARHVSATCHRGTSAAATAAVLIRRMQQAGFGFPAVAKPDIGRKGRGVRKVENRTELERYLAGFPEKHRVLVQEFVPYKGEAGVFYVREPGQKHGRITSLTLKFFPSVTGDGRSTLKELILADRRAGKVARFYLPRFSGQLDRVLPAGHEFPLVFTGNHCQGAIFRDGAAHATAALTRRIDRIAGEIEGFHFGRFDLRYESMEALERGEGFTIIELNGAGSEATHIWDAEMSLPKVYGTLFAQIHTAFRIGAQLRSPHGPKPTGPLRLLWLYLTELALMRRYPEQEKA